MKRNRLLVSSLVAIGAVCLLLSGCNIFGANPGGPDLAGAPSGVATVPAAAGTANSVSFRIVLPARQGLGGAVESTGKMGSFAPDGVLPNIQPDVTAPASPTVTFKLILVNVGNTTNPTTTLSKTVLVSSGTAMATFTAVPALTCIGDIHIEGGKIGSYTGFHGIADLDSGANVVELAPRSSALLADLSASVLEAMIANSNYFSRLVPQLGMKIRGVVLGLLGEATVSVDSALTAVVRVLDGELAGVPVIPASNPVIVATAAQAYVFG